MENKQGCGQVTDAAQGKVDCCIGFCPCPHTIFPSMRGGGLKYFWLTKSIALKFYACDHPCCFFFPGHKALFLKEYCMEL